MSDTVESMPVNTIRSNVGSAHRMLRMSRPDITLPPEFASSGGLSPGSHLAGCALPVTGGADVDARDARHQELGLL